MSPRIRSCTCLFAVSLACTFSSLMSACTSPPSSSPEIEIEPEWEDYDPIRDRLLYKIAIEVEVASPTQLTQCQCGLGLGSASNPVPDSFSVLAALVAIRPDNAPDLDIKAFAGFDNDDAVSTAISSLPGFNSGGTAYGFSADVDPFTNPILNPNEHLIMAFLVEFAPADFDTVNSNFIQFAAGSADPGHQISIFNNVPTNVNLPPFTLEPCDLNFDQECNVDDVNALTALGPIADGIPVAFGNDYFDLTGDGIIDLQDLDAWLDGAASFNGLSSPYKYGDANLDGFVDGLDFISWNKHKFDEALNWDEGNFNGDSVIDGSDFILWNSNKFTSSVVPEPTSLGWALLASISAGFLRKRTG